jgi:hypothetical protein
MRKCEGCGAPVDDNGSIECDDCQEREPTCLECGKPSPMWATHEECADPSWFAPLTGLPE